MLASDVIVRKTPAEVLPVDFDFTSVLAPGETIEQSPAPTVTATPAGLTLAMPGISGVHVASVASGGTDGTEYHVVCKITTSLERVLEACGYLHVRAC